jgi:small subunit ribosomal protein S16
MKMMGRKHRHFFRICAADKRSPRDGRVIEELGTYDPEVSEVDARVMLNHERVAYWLGVGAQPSQNVKTLIKKYGPQGTHLSEQSAARERLSMPKVVPPAGEAVFVMQPKSQAPAEAPAAAETAASAEAPAEATAPAEAAAESTEEAKS